MGGKSKHESENLLMSLINKHITILETFSTDNIFNHLRVEQAFAYIRT